jgi:hypothetical protein
MMIILFEKYRFKIASIAVLLISFTVGVYGFDFSSNIQPQEESKAVADSAAENSITNTVKDPVANSNQNPITAQNNNPSTQKPQKDLSSSLNNIVQGAPPAVLENQREQYMKSLSEQMQAQRGEPPRQFPMPGGDNSLSFPGMPPSSSLFRGAPIDQNQNDDSSDEVTSADDEEVTDDAEDVEDTETIDDAEETEDLGDQSQDNP